MNKKQTIFITSLTVAVVFFLSVLVGTTITSVNHQTEQSCFTVLAETSKRLAKELKAIADADRTILTAMAAIISSMDDPSDAQLRKILNAYRFESTYISYTKILRPDNTMLDANGTVRDVSDTFCFADEAGAGTYLSSLRQSTLDPNESVLHHAIPVIKDRKPIYILYGVISISEFSEKYKADIYDGQAYVFLQDGDTGDFFLDTWHEDIGNIEDYANRKLQPGYSWDRAFHDLKSGEGGTLAFTSMTINNVVFMRYDPTGINNWNVVVVIPKDVALYET